MCASACVSSLFVASSRFAVVLLLFLRFGCELVCVLFVFYVVVFVVVFVVVGWVVLFFFVLVCLCFCFGVVC